MAGPSQRRGFEQALQGHIATERQPCRRDPRQSHQQASPQEKFHRHRARDAPEGRCDPAGLPGRPQGIVKARYYRKQVVFVPDNIFFSPGSLLLSRVTCLRSDRHVESGSTGKNQEYHICEEQIPLFFSAILLLGTANGTDFPSFQARPCRVICKAFSFLPFFRPDSALRLAAHFSFLTFSQETHPVFLIFYFHIRFFRIFSFPGFSSSLRTAWKPVSRVRMH